MPDQAAAAANSSRLKSCRRSSMTAGTKAELPQQSHRAHCAVDWRVHTLGRLKDRVFMGALLHMDGMQRKFNQAKSELLLFS